MSLTPPLGCRAVLVTPLGRLHPSNHNYLTCRLLIHVHLESACIHLLVISYLGTPYLKGGTKGLYVCLRSYMQLLLLPIPEDNRRT